MANVILKHTPASDGFTVSTNMHRRDTLSWWELSDSERADFDYYGPDGPDGGGSFLRCFGTVYDLEDTDGTRFTGSDGRTWHIVSESFFSGFAFTWHLDDDSYGDWQVIVGRYCV